MTRGKQYVKKVFWYIGGKKRKQKEAGLPIRLLASIEAPTLGEIAKPIFGRIFGRGRRRSKRRRRKRLKKK